MLRRGLHFPSLHSKLQHACFGAFIQSSDVDKLLLVAGTEGALDYH